MNVLEMVSAINPIAFEIGGLQVRWYGIIIAFAIYLATTLADKEATRKGYRKEFIIDLVFWAAPLGFVGARLYYILFEWQYYLANPGEIIQIWHGGIAIYGGVIAGAATVYWFAKKRKSIVCITLRHLGTCRFTRTSDWALGKLHKPRSAWRSCNARIPRRLAFTNFYY